jgi:hypothetical protein
MEGAGEAAQRGDFAHPNSCCAPAASRRGQGAPDARFER